MSDAEGATAVEAAGAAAGAGAVEVRRYTPADADAWNAFVAQSKNGVFLFDRGYMDYHADRFDDHSLLFFHKGELVALLPAHRTGDELASHRGLTFGGLVTGYRMKTATMLEVVAALKAYCRAQGIGRVLYKAIPYVYHHVPADEDLYAIWREGGRLVRRDVAFAVDEVSRPAYREIEAALAKGTNSRMRNRARNLRRARDSGVVVERGTAADLAEFHGILCDVLMAVHGARPVHSLAELELLAGRFPGQIKMWVARRAGEMLAGAVVYESNRSVAHAQYSANSPAGRAIRALDVIFDHLSNEHYRDWRYFDFGTAVEDEGRRINESLVEYKESFGARAYTYDFYEIIP